MLDAIVRSQVGNMLDRFVAWLDRYGEHSYDFQTFYASPIGQWAKALYYRQRTLGTLAVSPIIFCEAFFPEARRVFWKPQRFPIADAHYAMGFALLSKALDEPKYYRRAVHFLDVLESTRCRGYSRHAWGYPFDWVGVRWTIKAETPLITTEPYVYEAFSSVFEIDKDKKWLRTMKSLARHVAEDYVDTETSAQGSRVSYTPPPEPDSGGVVNASAYRAFMLTKAALDFSEETYRKQAERNLHFVLESQNADGSWCYAMDGERNFVDHFHTCFVLKALAKIERLTGNPECTASIERGVAYYVEHLFDRDGLPKPFSRAPRLTIYRRELYDYAECINLAVLLRGRFLKLDRLLESVIEDLLNRWQLPNGSFRSRHLLLGWDKVPMHRWAQAQLFRSLCLLLANAKGYA